MYLASALASCLLALPVGVLYATQQLLHLTRPALFSGPEFSLSVQVCSPPASAETKGYVGEGMLPFSTRYGKAVQDNYLSGAGGFSYKLKNYLCEYGITLKDDENERVLPLMFLEPHNIQHNFLPYQYRVDGDRLKSGSTSFTSCPEFGILAATKDFVEVIGQAPDNSDLSWKNIGSRFLLCKPDNGGKLPYVYSAESISGILVSTDGVKFASVLADGAGRIMTVEGDRHTVEWKGNGYNRMLEPLDGFFRRRESFTFVSLNDLKPLQAFGLTLGRATPNSTGVRIYVRPSNGKTIKSAAGKETMVILRPIGMATLQNGNGWKAMFINPDSSSVIPPFTLYQPEYINCWHSNNNMYAATGFFTISIESPDVVLEALTGSTKFKFGDSQSINTNRLHTFCERGQETRQTNNGGGGNGLSCKLIGLFVEASTKEYGRHLFLVVKDDVMEPKLSQLTNPYEVEKAMFFLAMKQHVLVKLKYGSTFAELEEFTFAKITDFLTILETVDGEHIHLSESLPPRGIFRDYDKKSEVYNLGVVRVGLNLFVTGRASIGEFQGPSGIDTQKLQNVETEMLFLGLPPCHETKHLEIDVLPWYALDKGRSVSLNPRTLQSEEEDITCLMFLAYQNYNSPCVVDAAGKRAYDNLHKEGIVAVLPPDVVEKVKKAPDDVLVVFENIIDLHVPPQFQLNYISTGQPLKQGFTHFSQVITGVYLPYLDDDILKFNHIEGRIMHEVGTDNTMAGRSVEARPVLWSSALVEQVANGHIFDGIISKDGDRLVFREHYDVGYTPPESDPIPSHYRLGKQVESLTHRYCLLKNTFIVHTMDTCRIRDVGEKLKCIMSELKASNIKAGNKLLMDAFGRSDTPYDNAEMKTAVLQVASYYAMSAPYSYGARDLGKGPVASLARILEMKYDNNLAGYIVQIPP
eukprot:GHVS01086003.1.p1 GENE.GHVS01086003.1~~GHVS01086003.1.p1  ORF type:complete len:920 (-),score=61.31 GHVS01086003.1:171-2930(-)